MKHKVIFIVFFIFYLIVCYFHFRWEKYYERYFGDPYDPYPVSTLETPSKIDNALSDFIAAWRIDPKVPQDKKSQGIQVAPTTFCKRSSGADSVN